MATESDSAEPLTDLVGPLRVTRADKAELEQLAKRNDRSVAAEIRLAIKARLEQEGKK